MKLLSIIREEFKTIAGSLAILLVLMGGIFMYGLLYNYMYAPPTWCAKCRLPLSTVPTAN